MKLLIASDIHGSAYFCEKLTDAVKKENPDKILLLGDILYHGARNDLPSAYAPKKVIELLEGISDKIICVRGNCDSEVDELVLPFTLLAPGAFILAGDISLFATHGHIFNADNMPKGACFDVFVSGHTHIPLCERKNGVVFMNPGSVSIPKEGSLHSYMTFENGIFKWKTLDGEEYKTFAL